jgi:hypothetical protein
MAWFVKVQDPQAGADALRRRPRVHTGIPFFFL